jgi:hypothetical protein
VLRLLNGKVPLLRTVSLRVMKVTNVNSGLTPTWIITDRLRACVVSAMNYDDFRDRHCLFCETLEAKPQQLGSTDSGDDRGDWGHGLHGCLN